jgi:hypothetical protein
MRKMSKREQVEALKENWMQDPIYDIEEVEGFEEFKHELKTFRLKMEEEWNRKYEIKKERERNESYKSFNKHFSESIGYSDRFLMAQVFKDLTTRIEELENRIKILEGE